MKLFDTVIENGFWEIDSIEIYQNFIKFNISSNAIDEKLRDLIALAMCTEYEESDALFLSIIVENNSMINFNNCVLHISEMSHKLSEELQNQITNTIINCKGIAEVIGVDIELNTIEIINLLAQI